MIQVVFKLEEASSRPPPVYDGLAVTSSKPAEGSPKDNSAHGIAVETSRSGGAVARALTLGVSSCQEKNANSTSEIAHRSLFIGARCVLAVKMGKRSA